MAIQHKIIANSSRGTARGYLETFRYNDLFEELERQSALSLTTKLWVECFIKPVLILMRHQCAERMAKWELQISSLIDMMPYFFTPLAMLTILDHS